MKPEFSIVVPVYREEEEIAACIRFIEGLAEADRAEVIVADGGDGSTLVNIPETGLRIRQIETRKGRGHQIATACRAAEGEYVLILHVDTRLPRRALPTVRDALAHREAGAFDLSIRSESPIVRMIGIVGRFRSRISRIPYGDQTHFMRRSLLRRVGGYPDIPLMEDVAFMDKLKRQRIPIALLSDTSRTSDRRWRKEGTLFTTARNWVILLAYRFGASPARLLRWYKTHRGSPTDSRGLGSRTE